MEYLLLAEGVAALGRCIDLPELALCARAFQAAWLAGYWWCLSV